MVLSTEILSMAAVVLTCICNLPQLYRTIRTREVAAFEYKTLFLRVLISLLWFAYGFILSEWYLLTSSVIVFVCETALVICKFRFS